MAASDWFTIKVKGKQSHGAYPWNGIDPIAVASQIYTGLQMIVARESELTKVAGRDHRRQDQRRRSREYHSRGTDDGRHDPHARLGRAESTCTKRSG